MTIEISTLQHREMLHRRIFLSDDCWSPRCRAPHEGDEDIIQKYNKLDFIPFVVQTVAPELNLLHLDDERDLNTAAPRDVTLENRTL